jgi:hypothetical protein
LQSGFGKGKVLGMAATAGREADGFGKGQRRGGARHFSKPYVDSGLVYKVLSECQETLEDLGPYEHASKNNSPYPKGLVKTLPLWKGLLKLESSDEIHTQPLRTALKSLLAEAPQLNNTRHSGQVWANLKMERISTILFHVRKLGRESLTAAAAKLTKEDYEKLQNGLMLLGAGDALEKAKNMKKEAAEECTALVPFEPILEKRKLKKTDSDVTMDSKGFPAMFGSPQKEAKTHESSAAPKAFDRRRPGSKTAPLEKGELHQALGFGKAAKKKPAALEKAVRKNVGKKKPKKAGKKNMQKETASLEKEERKKWVNRKTKGKNPQRAYLLGTKDTDGKLRLIVEVTANRCPDGYNQIIDQIWTSLEKDCLTKAEALDLREKLCKEWGC